MPLDHSPRSRLVVILGVLLVATRAQALQTCDIDNQPVSPNNGATTAGNTSLMRCRDADTGLLGRQHELRCGKFIGVVREYRQAKHERSVDERGNRTDLSRDWNVDADGRRTLVRQEGTGFCDLLGFRLPPVARARCDRPPLRHGIGT